MPKFKCDIMSYFQTMWTYSNSSKIRHICSREVEWCWNKPFRKLLHSNKLPTKEWLRNLPLDFSWLNGCMTTSLASKLSTSNPSLLSYFWMSFKKLVNYVLYMYSQSAAFGSYLRGLPAGASLHSATPPHRSLRSPNPVYMTVEDP